MKKILVIGSPGAGKSVFARGLAEKTGLPLFPLDMIWHKPDKTTLSRGEFDRILTEILAGDAWILDGNYSRTLPLRLQYCDTVFLLDFPVEVCLAGAAARVGTKRPDLPWVEEEFDPEFKDYIQSFPETRLPKIYRLLVEYEGKIPIVIFRSRAESEFYLQSLSEK